MWSREDEYNFPTGRLRCTIFTTESSSLSSGRFMSWESPQVKANPVGGSALKKPLCLREATKP